MLNPASKSDIGAITANDRIAAYAHRTIDETAPSPTAPHTSPDASPETPEPLP